MAEEKVKNAVAKKNGSLIRLLCWIIVFSLCLLGGRLIGIRDQNPYHATWEDLHHLKSQMASLKRHLIDYKFRHGRYPTMDEGLAGLDNSHLRRKIDIYLADSSGGPLIYDQGWDYLGMAGNEHLYNSILSSDDETLSTMFSSCDAGKGRRAQIELAGDNNGNAYIIYGNDILSPWATPYVYENRIGMDKSKFADSPAESLCARNLGERVDSDVFILAPAGDMLLDDLEKRYNPLTFNCMVGTGMLLLCLVMIVAMVATRWRSIVPAFFAVLLAVGGWFWGHGFASSCYTVRNVFQLTSRRVVAVQRELLDKYHSAGVINDQTYRKSVAILDRDFKAAETQPTSGPASGATSEPTKK